MMMLMTTTLMVIIIIIIIIIINFSLVQQPLVGQGSLIIEATRPCIETLLLVGLVWGTDQQEAEVSAIQNTTLTTERHTSPLRFRNHNLGEESDSRTTS
jgi:hypothetical protein